MNNLKLLRELKKLTVRELAEILNISYSTISKIETGATHFNNEYIKMFTEFFDVSADYLLGLPSKAIKLNQNSIFKKVKVLGSIHAGDPFEALEHYDGFLDAQVDNPDDCFYLHVKGDSMQPTFIDGDYVLVKFQNHAEHNQIVVAGLNGNEATIKRYKKIGNEYFFVPDNDTYESIKASIDNEAYIVGVVVGFLRTKI